MTTTRGTGPNTWRPTRLLRRRLSLHPSLYVPLRRFTRPGTVVTAETDLVIEGFPRSGNTWMEALAHHCATRPLRLAHHSHAAAHVRHAHALGVPTVVLFRDPDSAVRSYLTLYANNLDVRDAFRDYITFYNAIRPLCGKAIALVSFTTVTERPAEVIERLARQHGLPVDPARIASGDDRAAVFARMDEKAARLKRDGGRSDSHPGHGPRGAEAVRAAAARALDRPEVQALRQKARTLHDAMTAQVRHSEGSA
ncbi:hypothetical protein [Vannielia litorea]|uniref:Sulfotransferase domain-containing protein n=1 Tax=Vannielia litorea TaxID=1217970 RepID=A0A1N6GWL7_9RHOB|nr:hypothetical protein [Vannielia litorea]SIO11827.1 hypothetical protein SAMN05444002_2844 [Vannielia litorea]